MNYRDETGGGYEMCLMYNLSSIGTIGGNFERALQNRPKTLGKISCSALSAPENERYYYDFSLPDHQGMDTIVNQVNSNF